MPSALVSRFRDGVAPRLLDRFANGGVKTVVRVVAPDPDPLLPSTVTYTKTDVQAVAKGVSASILTADSNLVATDIEVIVAAVDYVPSVGQSVEVNGKDRAIVRADAIPAAGDAAAYRFFVR